MHRHSFYDLLLGIGGRMASYRTCWFRYLIISGIIHLIGFDGLMLL